MDIRIKLLLLSGTMIMDLAYSATSPIIQIHFMRLIDSNILAISNIITTALAAIVNMSVQSDKLKDIYRHNFIYIILIDVICFVLVSFESLNIPEIRFLGLAILNAVSTTLWFVVMNDAINHKINGDDLTKWNSLEKTVNLSAVLFGSLIAVVLSINVEICILLQCIATGIMGTTDWLAYKKLRY